MVGKMVGIKRRLMIVKSWKMIIQVPKPRGFKKSEFKKKVVNLQRSETPVNFKISEKFFVPAKKKKKKSPKTVATLKISKHEVNVRQTVLKSTTSH